MATTTHPNHTHSHSAIVTLLQSVFAIPDPPLTVEPLKVTASFHDIYIVTYHRHTLANVLSCRQLLSNEHDHRNIGDNTDHVQLVLRIAGDHVPHIKTENEAAVLTWLNKNTTIPVPDLVAFDSTSNNELNREYLIMSRCPGVPLSDVYNSLDAIQLDGVLLQLMDMLAELHRHPFSHIGGFSLSAERDVVPAPMLDENFWFTADIAKYFESESFDTLNYHGPFNSYADYVCAAINSYLYVASLHIGLKSQLHTFYPRISAFLHLLSVSEYASTCNKTVIRLAHKDLHFANILYRQDTGQISAIIDWEFAGTIPFPQWDPVRAFLWNAQPGTQSIQEKYRLRDRFTELCKEKWPAGGFLADAEFTSVLQEGMHLVRNSLRGISTNVPRNSHPEAVQKWWGDLEKGLTIFGV